MFYSGNDKQILKHGILTKRSQGKSRLTAYNWRQRLFLLTPTELRYYDGTFEKKGKLKGTVELSQIKVVEMVDEEALDKEFCFQVQYGEWTLYIQAESETERKDWIKSIRDAAAPSKKTDSNSSTPQMPRSSSSFSGRHQLVTRSVSSSLDGNQDLLRVMVTNDFSAQQDGDLSLFQGDVLVILDQTDQHWWMARNEQGQEGFIPNNCVRRLLPSESEKYANDLKQAQETKPKSNVDKQRKGYKENRTSKSIPPTIELQENDIPFSDKRQPRLKRVFRRYFMCCFRY